MSQGDQTARPSLFTWLLFCVRYLAPLVIACIFYLFGKHGFVHFLMPNSGWAPVIEGSGAHS